jgi:hypothetical protein
MGLILPPRTLDGDEPALAPPPGALRLQRLTDSWAASTPATTGPACRPFPTLRDMELKHGAWWGGARRQAAERNLHQLAAPHLPPDWPGSSGAGAAGLAGRSCLDSPVMGLSVRLATGGRLQRKPGAGIHLAAGLCQRGPAAGLDPALLPISVACTPPPSRWLTQRNGAQSSDGTATSSHARRSITLRLTLPPSPRPEGFACCASSSGRRVNPSLGGGAAARSGQDELAGPWVSPPTILWRVFPLEDGRRNTAWAIAPAHETPGKPSAWLAINSSAPGVPDCITRPAGRRSFLLR